MNESKPVKFKMWLIPIIIGIVVLGIILFIGVIIFIIKTSFDSVSSNYQKSWICNDSVNIDINKNRINVFGSDRKNVINATYKMTSFNIENGHHEYTLKVRIFKKNGERYNNVEEYKIIMDSSNMDEMRITNTNAKYIYRCKKRG